MSPKLIFPALLLCILWACNSGRENLKHTDIPADDITELKNVIKAASTFEADRTHTFDSLRNELYKTTNPDKQFKICLRLSEEYRNFNTDSALYYANKCMVMSQDLPALTQQQSKIARINALSTAGLFTQALPIFEELRTLPVDPSLKTDLWLAGRTLFSYMESYVEGEEEFSDLYHQRYLECDDTLLRILPQTSNMKRFLECERLVQEARFNEARIKLEHLLNSVPDNSNLFGMAAFQMAEVYRYSGNEALYASYLAKAAVADVKGCIHEGIALPHLAEWLYERENFSDAFSFINFSLEDAMKGNARMRTASIARMVPLIDGAYREKINASRDEMMIYFLLASFLFVLTAVLLFILFRSMHRTKENEIKLASLSKRQEAYIGNFIALCASYADRLDSLSKTVSRKLSAGQQDELLKLVNSGKFTDNGNEQFFEMFDSAFLDIYPDFIEKINELLQPEYRFPQDIKKLSPECRVYAFVRLGVEESTRIAQILHYSVSTVYAYRNRMRNHAINRSSFDSDVMKISK
ncbi:MAG: hypothetical protein K2N03_06095 [Muribaculaceae bacterium]|nr:hypothetical protein [Muribaculaceae bacterium]